MKHVILKSNNPFYNDFYDFSVEHFVNDYFVSNSSNQQKEILYYIITILINCLYYIMRHNKLCFHVYNSYNFNFDNTNPRLYSRTPRQIGNDYTIIQIIY